MKKRKPGPQKRRTGATTSDLIRRAHGDAWDKFRGDMAARGLPAMPYRMNVIATRKTLPQRAWRAVRLAYYRSWLALDRAWIRRCKADNCLTPAELEAAAARDTELTLIIMQIEAD